MNSPIPPDIEALLSAEKRIDEASPARRARVGARLEASVVAVTVGLIAGAKTAAAASASGGVASWLARLARTKVTVAVAALAVGGGGAAIGYRVGTHAEPVVKTQGVTGVASAPSETQGVSDVASAPSSSLDSNALPRPASATASAVAGVARNVSQPADAIGFVPAASSAAATSAPATPSARPSASARANANPTNHEGTSRDESLNLEVSLVQMARAALARGDVDGALEATSLHARKHANGRLAEERESIAIQALVRAHRDDEARARAERFKARYPTSMLLPVIDVALRSIP